MVVFAGQGDPRRSMTLLWRERGAVTVRTAPGPRPGLTIDEIVDTAIAVADEHGMAGLSMRAVAERFGRTAMALYTYVPNKSELLDLMYDAAHAEVSSDHPGEWRAALTSWAEDLWACYLRHPWVLHVSQARPVLGPHEYRVLETVAGILLPTGIEPRVLWRAIGTLFHFVRGMAQTVAEARQAASATGLTDDEWWYARSALMSEVAPDFATRFPMLTALQAGQAFEPTDDTTPYLEREARDTFRTGLTMVLDGIAAARPPAAGT